MPMMNIRQHASEKNSGMQAHPFVIVEFLAVITQNVKRGIMEKKVV
jgi:hypothetical protein